MAKLINLKHYFCVSGFTAQTLFPEPRTPQPQLYLLSVYKNYYRTVHFTEVSLTEEQKEKDKIITYGKFANYHVRGQKHLGEDPLLR